jgi:hypothetical protein
MTYSVPDPADETTTTAGAGPQTDDPPLPPRLGAQADDLGPVSPDPTPSAGAHRSDTELENGATVDSDVADPPAVDADADPAAPDEPLRVPREDSEEYEKFVSDPAAAEAATRERINAQAEAEKAAAGVTPVQDS